MRFQSHELREHLGARNNRNRTLVRLNDLGIVVAHGGGANHDVRVTDVLSTVTFKDLYAHLLQAIGDAGTFQIRTGDTKAKIAQYLGNTGHADAADANEMDVLYPSKHPF